MVSSTPRPDLALGKDPVPIVQEAGWAPGLVWTGGKSRPHRDSIPGRPDGNIMRCRKCARIRPEYVTLIAFLRRQWLREFTLMLRYMCLEPVGLNCCRVFLKIKIRVADLRFKAQRRYYAMGHRDASREISSVW